MFLFPSIFFVGVNVLNTGVSLLKLGLLSKDDSLILTLWPNPLVITFILLENFGVKNYKVCLKLWPSLNT